MFDVRRRSHWIFYISYLCVGEGERITAPKFSDNLQRWNQEYFSCRWGLRDFRQGAITIGREFIAPDNSYDQADGILAESADHSTTVDHGHYAVVQGGVPRLSNNTLCKHRWLGEQWHSVLGLGPFPPPEAIRIKRRNAADGTTFQSMSTNLIKAMETSLDSFFRTQFKETLKDSISLVLQEQGVLAHGPSSKYAAGGGNSSESCPSIHSSHGLILNCADLVSTTASGAPSPAPSGYIQHDGMWSASPLPPSSPPAASLVEGISRSGSMDDLMFPSSSEIQVSPLADRKGKGRAYEPGQVPLKSKPYTSSTRERADDIDKRQSSSISPFVDRKGKRKAHDQPPQLLLDGANDDFPVQHQSSAASEASIGPVVTRQYRNRKHGLEPISQSEDEDQESSRSLKRLRRHGTSVKPMDMDVISLSSSDHVSPSAPATSKNAMHLTSSDDLMDFIVDDSSRPSSPPPAVQDIRTRIRDAIRWIRKDSAAKEKSQAQMDALIAVVTETRDIMIAMKTGGGKSMLWMVPAVLNEDSKFMVVCPFVALLEEQYAKTSATGLRCHNYSLSKDVPENVQVLFVQVEHCSSERFARYGLRHDSSTFFCSSWLIHPRQSPRVPPGEEVQQSLCGRIPRHPQLPSGSHQQMENSRQTVQQDERADRPPVRHNASSLFEHLHQTVRHQGQRPRKAQVVDQPSGDRNARHSSGAYHCKAVFIQPRSSIESHVARRRTHSRVLQLAVRRRNIRGATQMRKLPQQPMAAWKYKGVQPRPMGPRRIKGDGLHHSFCAGHRQIQRPIRGYLQAVLRTHGQHPDAGSRW